MPEIVTKLKSEIETNLGLAIITALGVPTEARITGVILECSINRSRLTLKCDQLSKEQEEKIFKILQEKLGE